MSDMRALSESIDKEMRLRQRWEDTYGFTQSATLSNKLGLRGFTPLTEKPNARAYAEAAPFGLDGAGSSGGGVGPHRCEARTRAHASKTRFARRPHTLTLTPTHTHTHTHTRQRTRPHRGTPMATPPQRSTLVGGSAEKARPLPLREKRAAVTPLPPPPQRVPQDDVMSFIASCESRALKNAREHTHTHSR